MSALIIADPDTLSWTELRRNIATDPAVAASGWTAVFGGGAAGVLTRPQVALVGSPTPGYARVTVTTSGTWFRLVSATPVGSVTPGETYTLSAWVRGSTPQTDFRILIAWRDAAGTSLGEVSSANRTVSATPARMSFTAVAPAGASYATLQFGPLSSPVGKFFDVAGVLFEKSATMDSFFYGASTSPDASYRYRWTGGENVSPSVYQEIGYATGRYAQPDLVLTYETERASGAVIHTLIDGAVAAVVRPALPRTGTLNLFFLTEAAAAAALELHSTASTYMLARVTPAVMMMTYVVGGTIRLSQTTENHKRWMLAVEYQEIVS